MQSRLQVAAIGTVCMVLMGVSTVGATQTHVELLREELRRKNEQYIRLLNANTELQGEVAAVRKEVKQREEMVAELSALTASSGSKLQQLEEQLALTQKELAAARQEIKQRESMVKELTQLIAASSADTKGQVSE